MGDFDIADLVVCAFFALSVLVLAVVIAWPVEHSPVDEILRRKRAGGLQ